jgi:hypothetical protein
VAIHSAKSNAKHNPGQPPHWARNKSTDHRNKIARHLVDAGGLDHEGNRHSVALAWRGLALLEDELIADGATPGRNAIGVPNADIPEKSPNAGELDIDWNACFPTRAQLDAAATDKSPLEPSRIGTPAELAYLASFGPNIDAHGNVRSDRHSSQNVTNVAHNAHPMHAEALRYADERSPEDRL